MLDVEAFASWLGERGVPAEHLPFYRREVAELATVAGEGPILPKHVDQLMRQREAAGASARSLANLQKVGDAVANFQRERGQQPQPAASPLPPPAIEPLGGAPHPMGNPPVAGAGAARPQLPPPPRNYTVQKSAGIAGAAVAVLAGVIGSLAGRHVGSSCSSSLFAPKGEICEGQYHSPTMDVDITFPSGWRRLPKEDQTQSIQGVPVNLSTFFHGGSSDDPDTGVIVGATAATPLFAKIDQITDDQLLKLTEQSAASGGASAAKAGGTWTKESCEVITWNGRAGKCKGVMTHGSEHRDAVMYVFLANQRMAFCVFIAKSYDIGVQGEIDGIVQSLSL